MSQMIIKHKVKDFDKWKQIFDSSDIVRRMYGEKEYKIFRNTGEPNDISVLFEWEDPHKIVKYAQTEELRKAMKLAGVLGEPEIFLMDEDISS